jgi:hypothetical protein
MGRIKRAGKGGEPRGSHVAYRHNGANDERVVVTKYDIICSLETNSKLRAAVILRILQCTARKEKASEMQGFFLI